LLICTPIYAHKANEDKAALATSEWS